MHQTIDDFLKNIQIFEKILGILYLHPCYLKRLLTDLDGKSGERIQQLIFNLYSKNSGSTSKNFSYLIAFCEMFIKEEKGELVKRKLKYNEVEIKFLKLYKEILGRSKLCKIYFLRIKEMILVRIIEKCSQKIE